MEQIILKQNLKIIYARQLRKSFPNIYSSLIDRNLIGHGNLIFTRPTRTKSNTMIEEPYIIVTLKNEVYEIKDCCGKTYLERNFDSNMGKKLRTSYYVERYERRKRINELKKLTKQLSKLKLIILLSPVA